jgi:hypothetical protein
MRDPGISAGRRVVIVAPEGEAPVAGVTEAVEAGWAAVVLKAAAVEGMPAEEADVKIEN